MCMCVCLNMRFKMCPSRGESKGNMEDLKGLFPPHGLKKKK